MVMLHGSPAFSAAIGASQDVMLQGKSAPAMQAAMGGVMGMVATDTSTIVQARNVY